MHGVKRAAAPTASVKAARKERETAKLQSYLKVEERFFNIREADQLDETALDATTALLALNPEYYTAWNYRRQILSHLFTAASPAPPPQSEKPDFFAAARTSPPLQTSDTVSDSDHAGPSHQLQVKMRLLAEDLELTTHALRAHPKVYWIWNHRKWCLIHMPDDNVAQQTTTSAAEVNEGAEAEEKEEKRISNREGKWKREMKLVDKMLELDARNFHGWDYRRYLISQIASCSLTTSSSSSSLPAFPASLSSPTLPSSTRRHHLALAQSELAYTLRKIESNFSNFSAWHWRSKLLPHVWTSLHREATAQAISGTKNPEREEWEKRRHGELELVRQALYTDPEDQSVWLYHAWLIELQLDFSPPEGFSVQLPSQESSASQIFREALLRREIDSIEALLEVEPDSRYCIEALARLKTSLAAQGGVEGMPALKGQVRGHIAQLMQVDPDRAGRYRDLMGVEGSGA